MIDRYLYGRVSRVSPEAPVPVVHWQGSEDRLGGAANVALNIRALGATPHLCSVLGEDENGRRFTELLPPQGIAGDGLLHSKDRVSTVKTRVIAQSQHLLRVDQEDTHALTANEEEALLERFYRIVREQPIDVLIFQDYNKGVLTPSLIESIIEEAKRRGIPTAVDPKFDNFWAFRGVTLFKPNLREIQHQLDLPIQLELADLQKAAAEIRRRLHHQFSLITLSERGLFIEADRDGSIIPTQPRTIADVCGAGDTVISVAALALALELPLQDMARLANLAGGQVCEKVGVVPVDKAQLQGEFLQLLNKEKL